MDKGKVKIAGCDTNVLSQDLESLSAYEVKGKEKIIEGACSDVSQDLMLKFSLAGVEHDVDILPPIDSIITSVKRGSPNEEPDAGVEHDVEILPPIDNIITSVKRGSPNEEPDADINLPSRC